MKKFLFQVCYTSKIIFKYFQIVLIISNSYVYIAKLLTKIEDNPFKSEYFYYCDVGCFRDDKKIAKYLNWPKIEKVKKKGIGDKFTILSVFPFTNDDLKYKDTEDLFKFLNINRLGGGIIGGSKETCLEWHGLFYDMMDKYFQNHQFAGKDQSIMASVYLKIYNTDKKECEKLFNLVKVANPFCNPWFYLQDYLL